MAFNDNHKHQPGGHGLVQDHSSVTLLNPNSQNGEEEVRDGPPSEAMEEGNHVNISELIKLQDQLEQAALAAGMIIHQNDSLDKTK